MNNEFYEHKKSDAVKWIIVFVLIAVLIAGVVASLAVSLSDKIDTEEPETETAASTTRRWPRAPRSSCETRSTRARDQPGDAFIRWMRLTGSWIGLSHGAIRARAKM